MRKTTGIVILAALVLLGGLLIFQGDGHDAVAGDKAKVGCKYMSAAATAKTTKSCAATCAAASACAKTASAASHACGGSKTKTASLADVPGREGTRVELTGKYTCGKCAYGMTKKCEPMFEAKNGKIYRLVKNSVLEEMLENKDADGFTIVTKVKKVDGEKYLEVKAFSAL